MQERTRYRVTGTIFLLSLAIVLVPMVFDKPAEPVGTIPPARAVAPPEPLPDFAEIVPESDVVERVTDLLEEVDAEGFNTDDGTRFGEPQLAPPDDESDVWAVQAAAFARQDNAFAFRDRLRAAGYEAFISTRKSDDEELLHRVAVGPLLSEQDAAQIVNDLAARFSVTPRIVEMAR